MEIIGPLEEIIDRCVQRLAAGETLDVVLHSYPERADELRAILAPAQTLLAAPVAPVRAAAASLALNRMLSEVQTASSRPRSRSFVLSWLGSLKARPLAYQGVALAGAVVLFGGVGIGAAAATGSTPRPVEKILRISSTSEYKATLRGVVISVKGDTLMMLRDGGEAMDVHTVVVTSSTHISRQDQRITREELRVGDFVEIDGIMRDSRFEATAIRAGGDAPPVAATTPVAAAFDAASAEHGPASGTPVNDDKGSQSGGASHGDGSEDRRTPSIDAAPDAGSSDNAPDAGGGNGDGAPDAGGGDGGASASEANPTASHEDGHGTPSATEKPAEQQQPTQEAAPTQKAESTPHAEPTSRPRRDSRD